MKLYSSRAEATRNRGREAFTMIEMIGVLAVIAILAAMLIPRVFQAVDTARVNSTAVACESVKAAAVDHYGKYGKFDLLFGTNQLTLNSGVYAGYDTNVLMAEGLLDKPFSVRIAGGDPSTNCTVQLVQGATANATQGYRLDGTTIPTATAQYVLEVVLYNVAAADAKELNDRIDGGALGAADLVAADARGRVEYTAPAGGATTVYVYLTHR
jgi:prepilin-type N-terminal cleavage/methylation domain-containing protein